MKPITKILIFLAVAFIIVIILTAASNKAVAPVTENNATSTPAIATSTPVASQSYTLAQVALHKVATDCWTAVGGNVYNLTAFVNQHPGGVANISKVCGIDGTAIFTAQHGGTPQAQQALASLKIGVLAQ